MSDAFRQEIRRWLEANAPPRMRTPPAHPDEICWGGKKLQYPEDTLRWRDVMADPTVALEPRRNARGE